MILRSLFALVTLIGLLGACSNKKETVVQEVETIESAPKAIVVANWNDYRGNAPVAIKDAKLDGNRLSLNVQYSGGCKEHDFQLVGHKMISKSLPPKRSVKLIHTNNDDDCRQLITEVLVFDIYDLAYQQQETSLEIDGFDLPVIYSPK